MNNIQRIFTLGLFVAAALLANSCASPKDFLYLQDMEPGEAYPVTIKHEALIQKDDRLKITVSSKNPELAIPFNIHGGSFRVGSDGSVTPYSTSASASEEGYRVDVDGNIDFPILGTLHVDGLTVNQAIDLISSRIEEGNYMKDPLISIEFLNFKYTVLGAVGSVGTYSVTGDRVTLFEAIARAGGLSNKAKHDKIAVIRQVGDTQQMYVADVRTKEVFNSPCWYLQQNDIVYVEPKWLDKSNEERGWRIATTVLSVVTAISSLMWAANAVHGWAN